MSNFSKKELVYTDKLFAFIKINKAILSNAASLVGSTGITSVLGLAYWWLASRQFSSTDVGFASAAIAAMTLLATFGILGMNTLLLGELARQRGQEASLISAALIVVGGVGIMLGIFYAVIAPHISNNLHDLGSSVESVLLFAIGVSFNAMSLVVDEALIGLVRGALQLWRNTLFAAGKLAALFFLGLWLSKATGMNIYITWVAGNIFSLLVLASIALAKRITSGGIYRPQFGLLRKLGPEALKHHALNLTVQAPALLLPVLVTAELSAATNAWFYISWTLSSLGNMIITSLTVALYAVSASQPIILARKMRLTLKLAFMACILINIVILFGSEEILNFFGHKYAVEAAWSLRILSAESLLFIIKSHYITVRRIRGQVVATTIIAVTTGLLEVGGSALGGYIGSMTIVGGLTGLSFGWFTAMCIETVCMFPTVYKAARLTQPNLHIDEQSLNKPMGEDDSAKMMEEVASKHRWSSCLDDEDTVKIPAIKANRYALFLSLDDEDTIKIPAMKVNRYASSKLEDDEGTVKIPAVKANRYKRPLTEDLSEGV